MADMASGDLTIKQLVQQSYQNSAAHGFWDSERTDETIPSKLMLLVSEAAEALEAYRDPDTLNLIKVPASLVERILYSVHTEYDEAMVDLTNLYDKWKAKPKGFEDEIADIFIRAGDLVGAEDIDIEAAIRRKYAYNVTRPHKHGKKV